MPSRSEKRNMYRVPTPGIEAICSFGGSPESYAVTDLSTGGARLAAGTTAPIGSPTYVAIFADGREPIRAPARVVHRDADQHIMGVSFEKIPEHSAVLLNELVEDATAATSFWGGMPLS